MRESSVRRAIRRWLEAQGAYVTTVHGGAFGKRGEADLIACLGGKYIWVETKAARGVAAPIQHRRLAQVRAAGGVAVIARSVGDVQQALASISLIASISASS